MEINNQTDQSLVGFDSVWGRLVSASGRTGKKACASASWVSDEAPETRQQVAKTSLAQKPKRTRPVVFLDRDGTINEEVEYLSDPCDFRLLPGAAEGVRRFNEAGWHVVVITNQSGIGRGYFSWETLDSIHQRMREELAAAGARVDGIYICPHRPEEECECRKPKTGMFEQALDDLDFSPGPCAVIGDKMTDLEPGKNMGCTTVLVETGYGAEHVANRAEWTIVPDAIVPDLLAATEWLLSRK